MQITQRGIFFGAPEHLLAFTPGLGPMSTQLEMEISEANTPLKPILKWAGGKRWQIQYLQPYWRSHSESRLVEPFCGGLAVALALRPERALLNDINPHLINFYRWVKRGLRTNVKNQHDEHTYYAHRARFNYLIETGKGFGNEAASLFYYLNKTGYNGLCRFNQKGGYNVPFGSHKTIHYETAFSEYRAVFRSWRFTNVPFEKVPISSGDFVYADPPYDVDFTQYSKGGFTWKDQVRVAEWLASHSGPVILSNQATPRVIKLYKSLKFKLRYLDAPRRISCNGDRTPAAEVLALRNL